MTLPPLPAIRVFEAVARHRSVTRAAAELHVTPGAVSQQLRKLEDFLGCALFERQPRGLMLTRQGADYQQACQAALALLARATAQLIGGEGAVVVVSCTPSFAMQWLLPRLPRFQAQAPGIEIRVSATNQLVDLDRPGVQFGVRHGLGRYPGLRAELLLDDDLIPVCSPRLIAPRRIPRLADLAGTRLLHDEHRGDWRLWLEAADAASVDWREGTVFVDSNGALEAALSDKGFALIRHTLVEAELAAGRLVALKAPPLETPLAYHLVYRAETLVDPASRAFRDWAVGQKMATTQSTSIGSIDTITPTIGVPTCNVKPPP